jgi:putative PIN family toxin of toxin-antitoxin system
LLLDKKITVCLSIPLLQEYKNVLFREKFRKYIDFFEQAEFLVSYIEKEAELYYPKTKISLISDEPDNRLLELADESNADFIITGNTNDFKFPFYKNTKIISAKEFWESF